jgi:hypothetical protein
MEGSGRLSISGFCRGPIVGHAQYNAEGLAGGEIWNTYSASSSQLPVSRITGCSALELYLSGLRVNRDLARRRSLFVDLPAAPT